jgi:HCOMODA/2-hydroxy-3-carboxy-muconic semialdehyde decarboxylase
MWRRKRLTLLILSALSVGLLVQPVAAQTDAGAVDTTLLDDPTAANRILYEQGVVDGFGHVSVRHPTDPTHFFMAHSMAPALVTSADILECDLQGEPLEAKGRAVYLERFIHSAIYKVRPDVQAIVHSHSPAVIPFGVTTVPLKPLYHMSSFLGTGVPVFDMRQSAGDTDMLMRTPQLGEALAAALGDKTVVLMRGHGAVAVGDSLIEGVFRAVYTEINAWLQAEALKLGPVTYLTPAEASLSMRTNKGIQARAWELWKRKVMAAHP